MVLGIGVQHRDQQCRAIGQQGRQQADPDEKSEQRRRRHGQAKHLETIADKLRLLSDLRGAIRE